MSISYWYLKKIGYLVFVSVIIVFWACGSGGSSNGIGDILDAGLDVGNISDCETSDPKHLWSKSFGGSSGDYGSSVSVDSSGNVYGTGYYAPGNINDFGGCPFTNTGGYYDIYLIKYAP